MRLWTIHPGYLDAAGLVAAWREGLLAQKVLEGGTAGYSRHPQLDRFRASEDPLSAVSLFLAALASEADSRGYGFDRSRIRHLDPAYRGRIAVGSGQVRYELELLRWKLELRAPERATVLPAGAEPLLNEAFFEEPGGIADWERPVGAVLSRLPPGSAR